MPEALAAEEVEAAAECRETAAICARALLRWRPPFALDRMLPTAIRRAVNCSREEEKAPEAVLRPHPTG